VPVDLKISFTDKEITPWSGMVFMKKLLDRTRILTELISCDLPEQGSNRGYSPIQLITCFLVSVWCGANRFEHLEISRFDDVLRRIFGFKQMAGHKAYQRYFSKFSIATNQKISTVMSATCRLIYLYILGTCIGVRWAVWDTKVSTLLKTILDQTTPITLRMVW